MHMHFRCTMNVNRIIYFNGFSTHRKWNAIQMHFTSIELIASKMIEDEQANRWMWEEEQNGVQMGKPHFMISNLFGCLFRFHFVYNMIFCIDGFSCDFLCWFYFLSPKYKIYISVLSICLYFTAFIDPFLLIFQLCTLRRCLTELDYTDKSYYTVHLGRCTYYSEST